MSLESSCWRAVLASSVLAVCCPEPWCHCSSSVGFTWLDSSYGSKWLLLRLTEKRITHKPLNTLAEHVMVTSRWSAVEWPTVTHLHCSRSPSPPDGSPQVVPALRGVAFCSEPDSAQEPGPLCRRPPADQGARPRPETLPGQDPRLQHQEQVSGPATATALCELLILQTRVTGERFNPEVTGKPHRLTSMSQPLMHRRQTQTHSGDKTSNVGKVKPCFNTDYATSKA